MDVKSLIESGTLEAYILGSATREEIALVQSMLHHREIKEELTRIENDLEVVAQRFAIQPPAELRSKVIDAIQHEANRKEMPKDGPKGSGNIWPISIAMLLAAVGIGFGAWSYSQQEKATSKLALSEQSLKACEDKNTELEQVQQQIALMSDTATQRFQLAPLSAQHIRYATVYSNSKQEKCLVSVAAMGTVPAGKSFQLWAIQNGKPVSLGVLETANDPTNLREITCASGAVAYAISLEPAGGSASPTEVILMSKS